MQELGGMSGNVELHFDPTANVTFSNATVMRSSQLNVTLARTSSQIANVRYVRDAIDYWVPLLPGWGGAENGSGTFPEAPSDGLLYGRNGLYQTWEPITVVTNIDGGTY